MSSNIFHGGGKEKMGLKGGVQVEGGEGEADRELRMDAGRKAEALGCSLVHGDVATVEALTKTDVVPRVTAYGW